MRDFSRCISLLSACRRFHRSSATPMTNSGKKLGLSLGFIGMCLFAGTLPATRLAVFGFDPWFLTVARAALAASAGFVVLLILRRRVPPRSLWLEMFAAALCTVVGFPLFAALAMMTVPVAHGGVVLGILPLATAAAAAIFAHERPSLGFWLASAAGAVIVIAFMLRRSRGEHFLPVIYTCSERSSLARSDTRFQAASRHGCLDGRLYPGKLRSSFRSRHWRHLRCGRPIPVACQLCPGPALPMSVL